MPSIIPGYEYDIFISYRQNDNQDGWVSEFINSLNREIKSTFKENISIYFDENPHDGLHEHHEVDDSLKEKLKCLIFIPIVSQTYCDHKCFAWQNEFKVFLEQAGNDEFGLKTKLAGGNVASRVLPVKIHDLDSEDQQLFESELGGVMRSINFIYKDTGVNRPLSPEDSKDENLNKTRYKDQVNKVANAIKEIVSGIKGGGTIAETTITQTHSQTHSQSKSKLVFGSIGIMAILLLAYFFYNNKSTTDEEEIDKSIAVLPFDNLSNDEEQQYFADGVMEDILTQLQRMGELRVTSKTSVEQYRETKKTASEIGKELKVSYLLEGSVRKAENQIMITAQLIKAGSDSHIWADNFTSDYTTKSLFEIQREIAENIVGELKLKITPIEVQQITQVQTDNKEAYEHFLRGRQSYAQYNKISNEIAIEQLQLAIQKDPQYAAAYGGLSNAFIVRNYAYGFPENWLDSAGLVAKLGLELDKNCAECYKALGLLAQGGRTQESIDYYEKALAVNPNYVMATSNSIAQYLRIGDFENAIGKIKKLRQTKNEFYLNLGRLNRTLGNDEKARIFLEKAIELEKRFTVLWSLRAILLDLKDVQRFHEISESLYEITGTSSPIILEKISTYWIMGKYPEVINYYEAQLLIIDEGSSSKDTVYPIYPNATKLVPNSGRINQIVTQSYSEIGETDKAKIISKKETQRILTQFNNNADLIDSNAVLAELAFYYSMIDKKEEAIGNLEKAIDMGYLRDISTDIYFESLYNYPRFQELVSKQKKKKEEVMAFVATYNFPEPEDL